MFWVVIYCGVFLQALVLGLILTPWARRTGERWGLMDQPGDRKIHRKTTPRSGGLAIYAAFVGTLVIDLVLFALLVNADITGERLGPFRANLGLTLPRFAAILIGLTFLFLIGLIDDRRGLSPGVKLVAQILSALPLVAAGVRIDAFLHGVLPDALAWAVGATLTIGWVVLLTNSLNFLDNMDGLTAGVSFVISVALALFSLVSDHVFMTAAYLALAGALLGFLRYNWTPARLFMGDGGSLTIGYALAALTINSRYYEAGVAGTGLAVLIPLVVMGVPLFDTATVMLIRWRTGAPLTKGDTNHISHRLVGLGFSRPAAVAFICLLTLMTALMALPLRYLPARPAALHLMALGLLFGLLFVLERVAQSRD